MAKNLAGWIVIAAARLGVAWALMLLVGIVHHQWLVDLPTIGYWTAVLIQLVVGLGQLFIAISGATINLLIGDNAARDGQLPHRIPTPAAGAPWGRLPFPTAPWHDGPKL